MVLKEVPSLAHPADGHPSAAYGDGAALVELVCLAAGQENTNIVKPALGKLQCNVLHSNEAGSTGFSQLWLS